MTMISTYRGKLVYLLFEFVTGYALRYAHKINEVDFLKFESAKEYISSETLMLEAFHLFSSTDEAFMEMNAISECKLISK